MICEKCGKNNATTHIRSVVNGVVVEKNLCGYCAAKEGYSNLSDNSLTQMLASVCEELPCGYRLVQLYLRLYLQKKDFLGIMTDTI